MLRRCALTSRAQLYINFRNPTGFERDTSRLLKLTQNRWFSQKGALANFTANSNSSTENHDLKKKKTSAHISPYGHPLDLEHPLDLSQTHSHMNERYLTADLSKELLSNPTRKLAVKNIQYVRRTRRSDSLICETVSTAACLFSSAAADSICRRWMLNSRLILISTC
jgi:hypothetical protein